MQLYNVNGQIDGGTKKKTHAPTFGQETRTRQFGTQKGRRAAAGHTAPFDLMHPKRIESKERREAYEWCVSIGKRRALFHGCQPKENVARMRGNKHDAGRAVIRFGQSSWRCEIILIVVIHVVAAERCDKEVAAERAEYLFRASFAR